MLGIISGGYILKCDQLLDMHCTQLDKNQKKTEFLKKLENLIWKYKKKRSDDVF